MPPAFDSTKQAAAFALLLLLFANTLPQIIDNFPDPPLNHSFNEQNTAHPTRLPLRGNK
jgi:hypothetical protein